MISVLAFEMPNDQITPVSSFSLQLANQSTQNKVLLQQAAKKLPGFDKTRQVTTVFTRPHYLLCHESHESNSHPPKFSLK